MKQPLPVYDFTTPAAKEFPSIITLENTNVCNLRCVHCPQGQGFPDRPDFHATYMSWDVYTKTIDEIAQYPITLLRYSPDGEALIHPQFLDQTAYAKAKGVTPVGLTTNGVLLDNLAIEQGKRLSRKTMMERLLEIGIDLIDISLDAARKESYERVRVGADYHRVWSNIHRLLYLRDKMKVTTKIMLSIIVQPEITQEEVDEFVKYWTPLVDRVIVRGYLSNLGLTPQKLGTVVDQMSGVERWPCPQFWKRITIGSEGLSGSASSTGWKKRWSAQSGYIRSETSGTAKNTRACGRPIWRSVMQTRMIYVGRAPIGWACGGNGDSNWRWMQ